MEKPRLPERVLLLLALLLIAACDQPINDANDVQPVTTLRLEERDFAIETRLTGSVSLYREEQIGFEVSGRLLSVLDLGREVAGPAFDESGSMVTAGGLIATLEDTRYRQEVQGTQARLAAAQRELEAVEAELRLARQTLDRQIQLRDEDVADQQKLDDAQSRHDSLTARREQRRAVIREIRESLGQAREDSADTQLFAPFSGRVARVHVSQGAVIAAGDPVVTLNLMDPIQVHVAVSANVDRRVQTGDMAVLFPSDPLDPEGQAVSVNALVYQKQSVADPDTRTFRIDLMARNARRRVEQFVPEAAGLPVVDVYLPVVRRFQGEGGPLFVHVDALLVDGDRTFVLRLPGVSFHSGAERGAVGRHVPDKVEVEVGEEYFTVNKWNFRSLAASGDLREGDFLVVGVRAEHVEGLAIGSPEWLLRPGDLVPVSLQLGTTPRGYYVPVDSITVVEGRHAIYTVEDGTARLHAVDVFESHRDLRRIEGEALAPGVAVVVVGLHYLSDGQAVNVVGQL